MVRLTDDLTGSQRLGELHRAEPRATARPDDQAAAARLQAAERAERLQAWWSLDEGGGTRLYIVFGVGGNRLNFYQQIGLKNPHKDSSYVQSRPALCLTFSFNNNP